MAQLDRTFAALAHPVRRAIVERLAAGPATVGEASAGLGVSKPAVSKHMRVLEDAGVIERRVEGRTHRLGLCGNAFADAGSWLRGDPPPRSEIVHSVPTILDTIGNTPLVRLRAIAPANGAELWVKLEYTNPSGSMKDRMALSMIEGAERDGLLKPGMTVVEYTGGSTGPAVALVCRAKGYRVRIVISQCFTDERFQLMRALGAELEVLPAVEAKGRVTA